MEILLNITWAVCSLILFGLWMRRGVAKRIPPHIQLLALGMTALLLLPVISLSDDLLAMQTPAETDTCVRRVQQSDNLHPALWPIASTQPPDIYVPALIGLVAMPLPPRVERAVPPDTVLFFIDSRPPPHA